MAQDMPARPRALIIGGSVGDAVDRRLLILCSTVGLTLTSVGLALNSVGHHPAIWALYVISAVAAGLTGFSNPARNAAIPLLVDSRLLVAAFSYSQVVFQVGTIVGPAVAGVLIATVPLRSARVTLPARPMSRVHTEAESP